MGFCKDIRECRKNICKSLTTHGHAMRLKLASIFFVCLTQSGLYCRLGNPRCLSFLLEKDSCPVSRGMNRNCLAINAKLHILATADRDGLHGWAYRNSSAYLEVFDAFYSSFPSSVTNARGFKPLPAFQEWGEANRKRSHLGHLMLWIDFRNACSMASNSEEATVASGAQTPDAAISVAHLKKSNTSSNEL